MHQHVHAIVGRIFQAAFDLARSHCHGARDPATCLRVGLVLLDVRRQNHVRTTSGCVKKCDVRLSVLIDVERLSAAHMPPS